MERLAHPVLIAPGCAPGCAGGTFLSSSTCQEAANFISPLIAKSWQSKGADVIAWNSEDDKCVAANIFSKVRSLDFEMLLSEFCE